MNGIFALDYASLVKLVINKSQQCQRLAMDYLVAAFVAAQEVGLHDLLKVIDGRPSGISPLISHMRGMDFSLD